MQASGRSVRGATALGALVVVLLLAFGACGGGEDETASSTIPVPSVPGPTTVPAPGPTAAPPPRPCDAQVFLQVMQSQGEQFELSPAVLGALTPVGSPQCQAGGFASQSFAGPPEDPGPFGALFGGRPDETGWELFAVNCVSSVAAGRRQVC